MLHNEVETRSSWFKLYTNARCANGLRRGSVPQIPRKTCLYHDLWPGTIFLIFTNTSTQQNPLRLQIQRNNPPNNLDPLWKTHQKISRPIRRARAVTSSHVTSAGRVCSNGDARRKLVGRHCRRMSTNHSWTPKTPQSLGGHRLEREGMVTSPWPDDDEGLMEGWKEVFREMDGAFWAK